MQPIVNVKQGSLRGKSRTAFKGQQYFSFEGVPYAKPPLGKLRFKAPVPPTPWTGIRNAFAPTSPCYGRCMITNDLLGSEDCLYLNIYTPQLPNDHERKPKPVLVYIAGGGFTHSYPTLGPDFLLSEDLVVITFHYRIGLLGFLSLEDTNLDVPGNAGLKDQVMVLKWVQDNVSCFGGDPSKVTLFGDSAGGCSAHLLMLSPVGKGLFHRVIATSGTAFNTYGKGQLTTPLLIGALGLTEKNESNILKILQDMSAKELVELQRKFPQRYANIHARRQIGPVVENVGPDQLAFLSEAPETMLKSGNFNQVPFMVGYASAEGLFWTILDKFVFGQVKMPICSVPFDFNVSRRNKKFEEVEQRVNQYYFGDTFSDYGFIKLQGDNYVVREVNNTVRLHTKVAPAPVYYFRLSLETSLNYFKTVFKVPYPGTCHSDILGYTFITSPSAHMRPNSTEDVCMRRWIKIIANFAQNGDPNPTTPDSLINVRWRPTENGKLHFLDIGDNLTTGVNPEEERMKFWDDVIAFCATNSKL